MGVRGGRRRGRRRGDYGISRWNSNRMNRHVRRQHDTSADGRHGRLPFHTRLTLTLFLIRGANDLVLFVGGAGDFHGRGHGVQEVPLDNFF